MHDQERLINQQILQLVDLLLKCPSIQDKSIRNDVLLSLPDNVRNAIPRRDQARADVVNIVKTCNDYPGQIEALIESVRLYEGGSDHMHAINAYIQTLFPTLIPRTRIAELHRHLARVTLTDDDMQRLYRQSLLRGQADWHPYPRGTSEADTLKRIIHELAQTKIDQSAHPLVDFVTYLAALDNPSVQVVQAELQTWVKSVAGELGVQVKKDDDPPITTTPQTYLLVQISPKQPLTEATNLDTARFYVEAWLLRSDQEHDTSTDNLSDEQEHSLKSIPEILQRLIKRSRALVSPADLTVEFFLPVELLLHDVDQWEITLGIQTITCIGIQHRVVVRSLERVQPQYVSDLRPQWEKKWQRFKGLPHTHEDVFAWARTTEECNASSLPGSLLRKDIVGFAQVCLLAETHDSIFEMLYTIIDAGIPIAFFPRYKAEACLCTNQIEQFIKKCLCLHSPTVVWQERQEAVRLNDTTHLAHHMTLLWDDPTRLPPPARALFPGMT